MHEVHTRIRLAAPFTIARTVCKLMFQRRLVTLWAWLIRCPKRGPRPQTSHTLAMVISLLDGNLSLAARAKALQPRSLKNLSLRATSFNGYSLYCIDRLNMSLISCGEG